MQKASFSACLSAPQPAGLWGTEGKARSEKVLSAWGWEGHRGEGALGLFSSQPANASPIHRPNSQPRRLAADNARDRNREDFHIVFKGPAGCLHLGAKVWEPEAPGFHTESRGWGEGQCWAGEGGSPLPPQLGPQAWGTGLAQQGGSGPRRGGVRRSAESSDSHPIWRGRGPVSPEMHAVAATPGSCPGHIVLLPILPVHSFCSLSYAINYKAGRREQRRERKGGRGRETPRRPHVPTVFYQTLRAGYVRNTKEREAL